MKFKQKRELILNGKLTKTILTVSLPIMLNNLIQTLFNLTDTWFIGRLPGNKIASIAFVWPIIFFLMAIGIGVSMAGTGLISQYLGSNQIKKAKKISGQIILFAFSFSTIFGIIGSLLSHTILSQFISGDLLKYANQYLEIMFLGMPSLFLMFAYRSIKRGEGDTYTPMKITAFAVVTNIILDPIFMFSLNLGVKGAAYATVLSRFVWGIFALNTLFKDTNELKLSIKDLKFNKNLMTELTKVGIPASIGQSSAAIGFLVLNNFIVSFGQTTLTAFTLGNRISSLIMMPAMGIGNAIAPIVGQNLGADQIKRAKESIKKSVSLTTLFLVIGGSILLYFSEGILKLFTKDLEILNQGLPYLRLITLSLPLMGYFQILNGIFQGSGHTKSAMFLMAGRLWGLRIPLIIIFKNFTNLGSLGIWYAMILSNFLIVFIGFLIYKTGKWENKIIKSKI